MTKRTFKDFPIRELDGGINLENSPNEIENKEGVECVNFNFKGNKLINNNNDGVYNFNVKGDTFIENTSKFDVFTAPTTRGIRYNENSTKVFLVTSTSIIEYLVVETAISSEKIYLNEKTISEDNDIMDVAFNLDGTKMFVLGNQNNKVYQYTLTTGFSISTATYDSSYDFSAKTTSPNSIDFKADGTKLYISSIADGLFQYSLTAYTVTTCSFVATNSGAAKCFRISGDGTFIYMLIGNVLTRKNLTTPYDIIGYSAGATYTITEDSEATGFDFEILESPTQPNFIVAGNTSKKIYSGYAEDFSFLDIFLGIDYSIVNTIKGIKFNTDGTKLFLFSLNNNYIQEYSVSTPFSISSTITYLRKFNGGVQGSNFCFNDDGTKLYVLYTTSIYEYTFSTGFDLSTNITILDLSGFPPILSGVSTSKLIKFNNDGTKMYLLSTDGLTLREYNVVTPFKVTTAVYSKSLTPGIGTCNGFDFNYDGTKLFIGNSIYDFNLSTAFDIGTAVNSINSKLINNSYGIDLNKFDTILYSVYENKVYSYSQLGTFDNSDVTFAINGGQILSLDVIDGVGYFPVKRLSTNIADIFFFTEQSDGTTVFTNKLNTFAYGFYLASVTTGVTYSIRVVGIDFVYDYTFSYTAVGGDTPDIVYGKIIDSINLNSTGFIWGVKGKILDVTTERNILYVYAYAGNNITATPTNFTTTFYNDISVGSTLPLNNKIFKSGKDIIYLNGQIAYYLQYVKADGSTWDAYNTQRITSFSSTGDVIGVYYNGKLILCDTSKNILYHSKTIDVDKDYNVKDFGTYNAGFQQIGGDGNITGIMTGENGIYVFKEDEIYYSNTEKDTGTSFSFIFNRITNNGASNQKTIERVGQDIFYYDKINKKIRRLSYEQNLTTLRDTGVSNKIDSYINSLPYEQSLIKMKYSYPNLKLHLKSNTLLNYNDITLIYNVDNKSWAIKDDELVRGGYGKYYFTYSNLFYTEGSFSFEGNFLSKEYDFGDGVGLKKYGEIEIYGKRNENVNVYLDIYIDGELTETITIEDINYFRNRFELYEEGKYFQFGIRYEGIGYIEINEINIKFKKSLAFENY